MFVGELKNHTVQAFIGPHSDFRSLLTP